MRTAAVIPAYTGEMSAVSKAPTAYELSIRTIDPPSKSSTTSCPSPGGTCPPGTSVINTSYLPIFRSAASGER